MTAADNLKDCFDAKNRIERKLTERIEWLEGQLSFVVGQVAQVEGERDRSRVETDRLTSILKELGEKISVTLTQPTLWGFAGKGD